MAEKYRAKSNNLNEEIPEKTEKEKRQESATKVSKVAAKGAAEYFAPGVGGKLVDMASKTKAGQQILNRAGKTLSQNPVASQLMKKADDSGLVDGADKAVDMLSKNPQGLKGNTKNAMDSNNGLENNNSLNSNDSTSNESSGFNLFNEKSKKSDSFFGSAFGNGEINLFKLIGKKYLIITACSCFGFLLLLTVIVSAKDFANLDLTNGDTSMTSGAGSSAIVEGKVLGDEPDPSLAIKYWKDYLNVDDFEFPKDELSGLSLGAWPKNHQSISKQLTSYKEYNGLIWPTTPINNTYTFVYEHNGIDIMANVGTPVYSPVDGTLIYSEWGHTVNKGSDETAYSVSISLDTPISYAGVNIKTIFLTHLCGIRYRCSNCNQKVQKGELLGYTGNAAGDAASVGWAPHLHMTLYDGSSYDNGVYTSNIQKLYNITSNTVRKAGE